jgi:hypothetical protein
MCHTPSALDLNSHSSGFIQARDQHEASSKQTCACYLLHAGFLLGLLFGPEDGSYTFFRSVILTFIGLHGIVSQRIELFL